MRLFWIKISLFLFSVLIFISGVVFLLFNHRDHLINFVPAKAEIYLNTNSRQFSKLSEDKKSLSLTWLENRSGLGAEKWRTILENAHSEIGLFSINGQVFGLMKETKRSLPLILQQTTNVSVKNNIIYFPELKLSGENLSEQKWFNDVYKKISFRPIHLYAKNASSFKLGLPNLSGSEKSGIAILGKISKSKIKLTLIGSNSALTTDKRKPQLKLVPSDTKIYFNNISAAELNQEFEYTPENLDLHILKSINGAVEYLKTSNSFQILVDKNKNSFADLQETVLKNMALTFPAEKSKFLPDGTVSTQYIADPSLWKFEVIATDAFGADVLREPRLGYDIEMSVLGDSIIISSDNHKPFDENYLNISPYFTKCSIFGAKGKVYFNYNNDLTKPIVVISKNNNQTHVCLY